MFKNALGLRLVPWADPQRQQLDAFPEALSGEVKNEAAQPPRRAKGSVSALSGGRALLDIDPITLPNSGMKK